MSNYISINIQTAISPSQSIHHSNRSSYISYLVSEPNTVTKYRHELSSANIDKSDLNRVGQYFELRAKDIADDYKKHNQRSMQKNTKLYQEAVISFGRERFEANNQDDILKATEDFCNDFEQKYNVKVLMSSLHLDEGHKDDTGKIQHNYHTHLLIENYSFDTHKTGMRKVDYRKLQTELANEFQHLGFERGDPERKAQRLEHREYREMMEQKKQLEKEIYHEHYEPLSQAHENLSKNHDDLKAQIQPLVDTAFAIAKEQNQEIKTYDDVTILIKKRLEKLAHDYKKARQELKDSKVAKQPDYQELKQEYETIKKTLETSLKKDIFNAREEGFQLYGETLEKNNSSMARRACLKGIEKPSIMPAVTNQISNKTLANINRLLEIKQRIEEKPIIQEVIIKKEVIIEVPKTVEKVVEKIIEKPIIVNVDENKRLRTELEAAQDYQVASRRIWRERHDKLVKEKQDLSQENEQLKEKIADMNAFYVPRFEKDLADKKELKEKNERLTKENNELKIENKALFSAIGRFLELDIGKHITEGAKTILERFNEVVEFVKSTFNKNQELVKESKALKKQLQEQQHEVDNDCHLSR
jgi:hypothetical protein